MGDGSIKLQIINDQLIFASGWKEGRMKQIVINRIENKFDEYDFNFISDQFCVKDNFVIFSVEQKYKRNYLSPKWSDIKLKSYSSNLFSILFHAAFPPARRNQLIIYYFVT